MGGEEDDDQLPCYLGIYRSQSTTKQVQDNETRRERHAHIHIHIFIYVIMIFLDELYIIMIVMSYIANI